MSLSLLLRKHFKGLMFDGHRHQVALMVTPISKASVGTSADAAHMSAYATMISTFDRVSPKTKWHCAQKCVRHAPERCQCLSRLLQLGLDLNHMAVVQANSSHGAAFHPILKRFAQMTIVIGNHNPGRRRSEYCQDLFLSRADAD